MMHGEGGIFNLGLQPQDLFVGMFNRDDKFFLQGCYVRNEKISFPCLIHYLASNNHIFVYILLNH